MKIETYEKANELRCEINKIDASLKELDNKGCGRPINFTYDSINNDVRQMLGEYFINQRKKLEKQFADLK